PPPGATASNGAGRSNGCRGSPTSTPMYFPRAYRNVRVTLRHAPDLRKARTMKLSIPAAAAAGMLLVTGCSLTEEAASDSYPSRSISVIVPVPAGSSTDLSTRILTPCLEKELDTTVVVENREGG